MARRVPIQVKLPAALVEHLQERVERGDFKSLDALVESALKPAWLPHTPKEIAAKIEQRLTAGKPKPWTKRDATRLQTELQRRLGTRRRKDRKTA